MILVDLLEPELADLNPKNRTRRYDDHYHVNAIIGRTIDSVQDQVLEALAPNLDLVDKILRPIDEWLISELITKGRDEVWKYTIDIIETIIHQERERKQSEMGSLTQNRA